jgi:hypothetical protein
LRESTVEEIREKITVLIGEASMLNQGGREFDSEKALRIVDDILEICGVTKQADPNASPTRGQFVR